VITLKFAGYMAKLGFDQDLDVRSIEELFRAIRVNFPEFACYLANAAAQGLNYQISVDGRVVPPHALDFALPASAIVMIFAVPSGAGGKGFRIIAGVALLALGGFGVGFLGIKAGTLAITGAALLFSAFRGQQKPPKEAGNLQSSLLGGVVTSGREGDQIPVIYGIHMVGWLLASQRATTTYKPA